MSGNHKRKHRAMHKKWMADSAVQMIGLLYLLDVIGRIYLREINSYAHRIYDARKSKQ